ncbi:MAG: hypothetical protein KKC79_05740 [Gammaproteobacteria bacterium]|nr:hypothetical protein [Gammaproteobacteria bacterium]MBU1441464.1 hypothetical protein [Gammaproteobacteria bacterium]MBU2287289.1 hypothetical protein [Gammaproteobacteria bacterium]MBU2408137.1 hypothetical protein [Gammaproteobacteria bacterium]
MTDNVESPSSLQTLSSEVLAGEAASPNAIGWYRATEDFLQFVQGNIPGRLDDTEFLDRLFNDESISSTGQGRIKLHPALSDAAFRAWFAEQVRNPLPAEMDEATVALREFHDELASRLRALCGKTPWLKLRRALCALYPSKFTSIVNNESALFDLYSKITGAHASHFVPASIAIRGAVDAVLPSYHAKDLYEVARRINLPWMLLQHAIKETERSAQPVAAEALPQQTTSTQVLVPIQATLRRKGLTGMGGGFAALLDIVDDLKDGLSRIELEARVREANPRLGDLAVGTTINVIAREFDLCAREGDVYRLSGRGSALRESRDPDVLADHLLTKVLGFDNVLKLLEEGAQDSQALISFLKEVNPGWTSNFAPTSQLGWLRELGLVNYESRQYSLTDRGHRWAEMVTWVPAKLPPVAGTGPIEDFPEQTPEALSLPSFADVADRLMRAIEGQYAFDPKLIVQLHTGLWFHPTRHFVVLTGISGSGKTQLALQYARALTHSEGLDSPFVEVIPVQPGWHDPSPMLGYVNPLQDASYRSAPFLELVLRAAADPGRAYVAILDEMNLSHPEQYFAPVLSAMESRVALKLHQMDSSVPVPPMVPYPSNLAIIGTLNMDETTHGLSDKVLDRAFTLEFWNIDVDAHPAWANVPMPQELKIKARAVLNGLEVALSPCRLHFGMRTVDDVLGYLSFQAHPSDAASSALDDVVYAKVLPKLRGEATPRFQEALKAVLDVLETHGLARCTEKVKAMREDLKSGSARFWR